MEVWQIIVPFALFYLSKLKYSSANSITLLTAPIARKKFKSQSIRSVRAASLCFIKNSTRMRNYFMEYLNVNVCAKNKMGFVVKLKFRNPGFAV